VRVVEFIKIYLKLEVKIIDKVRNERKGVVILDSHHIEGVII